MFSGGIERDHKIDNGCVSCEPLLSSLDVIKKISFQKFLYHSPIFENILRSSHHIETSQLV